MHVALEPSASLALTPHCVDQPRREAVRLANVRVDGDSMVGVRTVSSRERVAIAVADVQSVAVARSNVSGTALAIGTTAAIALLAFLVHILMTSD